MATMYSKFKRQLSDVREEIARQIPMDEIRDSVRLDLPSGPGGEPPSTPSSLVASPSDSNVLLTWSSSIGATSYTIRRSTGPQDPWLIVGMNIVELAWTDTDVQPGKTYHYVVSGVNGTGESGNSDEAVAVMPGTAPEAAAPASPNGNGDYPKEPPVPEEKGTASGDPAPEIKPT
jgi:hypothetical protein